MAFKATGHVYRESDGEDLLAAVEAFRAAHGGLPEYVECMVSCNLVEIAGLCETCQKVLCEFDDYFSDADGIIWCKEHGR